MIFTLFCGILSLSARRQTAFWLPRIKFHIDGMSLVQKLKADQKTFSEEADTLLCMALSEYSKI